MNKLTNSTQSSGVPNLKLTEYNKVNFKISIEENLESKFSFKKLNPSGIKKFHTFIEKIAGKEFSVVESNYRRKDDKNDTKLKDSNNRHGGSYQIVHYGDSTGIRLHGFLRNGYFVLTRVDCNHKKHK